MAWHIVLRDRGAAREATLPAAVLTSAPGFLHESMPAEVGLMLPTNEGPKALIDRIVAEPSLCADAMLGLFLASPFLNLELETARLIGCGVAWLTNLPSVAQQDDDFLQQLSDVGLDQSRELDGLRRLAAQGFNTAVVVTDAAHAAAAAQIAPKAMIVLPHVADFAAGFPSQRQRGAAAQAVHDAARAAGWSGPLLGLAEPGEAAHERLWPACLDGLLCRPQPLGPSR